MKLFWAELEDSHLLHCNNQIGRAILGGWNLAKKPCLPLRGSAKCWTRRVSNKNFNFTGTCRKLPNTRFTDHYKKRITNLYYQEYCFNPDRYCKDMPTFRGGESGCRKLCQDDPKCVAATYGYDTCHLYKPGYGVGLTDTLPNWNSWICGS